jgi:DNA-binding CsgD family transcriptional regulator
MSDRILLVGAFPTQRERLLPMLDGFDVEVAPSLRTAKRHLASSRHAGIIVLVQSASDLAAALPARTRGNAPPMLVVGPRPDENVASRAQLADAQCVFGVRVDANVRAFVARLVRRAPPRPRSPQALVARHVRAKGLSPRQHSVLLQIASGVQRAELAAVLGVSRDTVKTHVRHLLRAFGVASCDELYMLLFGIHRRRRR